MSDRVSANRQCSTVWADSAGHFGEKREARQQIGNLSATEPSDLRTIYQQLSVDLAVEPRVGVRSRYGYILFLNPSEIDRAISALEVD